MSTHRASLALLALTTLASWTAGCGNVDPENNSDVGQTTDALISVPTPVLALPFAHANCVNGAYVGPGSRNGVACAFSPVDHGGKFDGGDDVVEIADSPSLRFTTRMTAAAWVKPASTTGTRTIVGKWASPDSYSVVLNNGSFTFQVLFSNGTRKSVSAPAASNAWTHVAGVYDGAKLLLYLNGTLAASTNATGTLATSTRPIAIGNWPAGSAFLGVIDEVGLYNVALTAPQVAQIAGRDSATPAPKNRKALWVVYNPILSDGKRVHERYGWEDPQQQIPDIMASLQVASGKYADYQIREINPANYFPPLIGAPTMTEASYASCIANEGSCSSNTFDYARMFQDLGLCSRIQAGDIDEVMVYGADWFGIDEFAMKIPGDRMPYNTPTNQWLYDLRKKNLPDCGRTYFVMGFNYAVGVDNAIHSFGHRTESALALTVGRGYWDGCAGHPGTGVSDFDRFTCADVDKTPSGVNVAHVGNVHMPPNGLEGYDYGNTRFVTDASKSWFNYPFTTNTLTTQNCNAWGCNQQGYMLWWLNHLPARSGVTANGNLKNWWKYVIDFDGALSELGK